MKLVSLVGIALQGAFKMGDKGRAQSFACSVGLSEKPVTTFSSDALSY